MEEMTNSRLNLKKTLLSFGAKNEIKQDASYRDRWNLTFRTTARAKLICKKLEEQGYSLYRDGLEVYIKK
jgi:hypothetical protein